MSAKGPILVIEDDEDDRDFYQSVFTDLGVTNEVVYFENAEDGYRYLDETTKQPFLIISDINLPGMTGIDFKKKVQENERLKQKSIPFIFLTTSGDKTTVNMAYSMMVQGFFTKPASVTELAVLIDQIISYWKLCRHPNSDQM